MRRSILSAALLLGSAMALADQGPTPNNPVTTRITGLRTFDIGPGQQYTFDTVPWGALTAGDVVNVHHQPTPYVTKIGLKARGTASAPVLINGVTDANGNRPVISFANARTAALATGIFSSTPSYGESLGGIVIKRGTSDAYEGPKPSHIQIKNLEVRDARGRYTTLNGRAANYSAGGCIYVHVGAHILIENVIATNCAFGVFAMQKDDLLSQTVEDLTVRNSRIYGNGVANSWFEHNLYIQGIRPVIEGNYIGQVISGSRGSSFKDRSARLIFRNNYVVASARALDIVHVEEGDETAELPEHGSDYVYNNTIINRSAPEAIHFGGDNFGEQECGTDEVFDPGIKYRENLYFWNNRVEHTVSGWRNMAFGLSLRGTNAYAWGNTFTFGSQTNTHYWLECAGNLHLGENVVNGNVMQSGRDGSNPTMYMITTGNPVPTDPFLQTLLAN